MAYKKEKLESQIKRNLSELLIKEVKDPRVGFVTITGVTLSKDYTTATVGLSVLGNPRDIRKSFEGIQSSAGYLQFRLNKSMKMRHAPRIIFRLDSSVVEGVDMVNLIDSLETAEQPGDESADESNQNGA